MQQTDKTLFTPLYEKMDITFNGHAAFSFYSVDSLMHHHSNSFEIILITKGTYIHMYEGKNIPLPQGTLLLLKPETSHRLYTEPMAATHFVTCVDSAFFTAFCQQHFPQLKIEKLPDCSSIMLDDGAAQYLEYLGHMLCEMQRSVFVSDSILYTVLSHILLNSERQDKKKPYYIDRILDILNNPINLSLSVATICSYYSESTPTILKNFKKQTGCTIVQYKNRKRLEFACNMLQKTDLNITEIAFELQYENLGYFLRAFKKKFGMTPSEYRQQNQ